MDFDAAPGLAPSDSPEMPRRRGQQSAAQPQPPQQQQRRAAPAPKPAAGPKTPAPRGGAKPPKPRPASAPRGRTREDDVEKLNRVLSSQTPFRPQTASKPRPASAGRARPANQCVPAALPASHQCWLPHWSGPTIMRCPPCYHNACPDTHANRRPFLLHLPRREVLFEVLSKPRDVSKYEAEKARREEARLASLTFTPRTGRPPQHRLTPRGLPVEERLIREKVRPARTFTAGTAASDELCHSCTCTPNATAHCGNSHLRRAA